MFLRMDMFFHICSVEREIYWQLGEYFFYIKIFSNFSRSGSGLSR